MYLCCTYWNFDVSCLLQVRLSPRRLGRMSASPHVSLAGFAYLEPLSRPIRVDDSSYNSPEHEQHRALELPSKLASLTERLAAQSNWVRRGVERAASAGFDGCFTSSLLGDDPAQPIVRDGAEGAERRNKRRRGTWRRRPKKKF